MEYGISTLAGPFCGLVKTTANSMAALSTQADVGFHKRRTETKFEKPIFFWLFGFSCTFRIFWLFDFSGFLALFGLFGLFYFWTFRVFGHFSDFVGFSAPEQKSHSVCNRESWAGVGCTQHQKKSR